LKKRYVANLPASVQDRLLKIAKESGAEFQDLLIIYALERWLYRMTRSAHKDRFVLKGAMGNIRMKDYFDLWVLTESFDFVGATLMEEVRAIFVTRGVLEARWT